ncbi:MULTISPECIES: S9 family peptidase [Lysinibacillus]|uniref:S9 family peptidase n=1 Tax=Lysinibacillus fusiformis TaxID=28031 RepID=A0A2I0V2U2_9BACI|nr:MULTISPECIES: S9 family peptidase [Lysinibacillus]PKU52627.1 S9 family peptidase [Lysinibacillus fusiformis]SCY88007.1 Dipeptidyl aminopeptidase/acylaminoacyl peptidase [Lysinibacillus sp. SG9]SDB38759.1 Dipeptidyl aminopeptidase/acylaminoacyl peptidase [Lysinibacillus sp. TC-37]SFT03008.1 Dipeptidyl aminopeptidase/acylaminoacyl peptidase [Lysinibacillus sp. SG55]
MKKRFLSASLAIILTTSVAIPATMQEVRAANETNSFVIAQEQRISVQEFLNLAVTALTFQHGSDSMRQQIIDTWVKAEEFADLNLSIKRDEAARILVRALNKEEKEASLAEYLEKANKLGIFKNVSVSTDAIAKQDAVKMLNNAKQIKNGSNNKGVKEISVEDFMKNPGNFGYELSPDGNYITFASAWNNRSNVFVKKMNDDSEPVRVSNSKDRDIAGFFWKENSLLYLKDKGGDENFHIYSTTFNGSKEKDLTPYPNVTVGILSGLQGVKDEILIMMNKEDATVFDVYKLNVKTGKTKHVAKNPGNITNWLADRNGNVRIAVATDGVAGTILYRDSEKDEFKPFIEVEAGDEVVPLAFSKDNQTIYATSNKGRDKVEVVKYDLEGNEKVIMSNDEVDVSGVLYSAEQDKLLYGAYVTDKLHYQFFDKKFEKLFRKIQNKLGVHESELGINDYNKEMTKFIVSVSSDTVYGKYYYYDSITGDLTELATLSPWLKPEGLAEMHPISYKSRDGLTINGYLTLPKNQEAKDLPLIVNPHGGPWARDMWGFNPEVQLLANRGYAVLQVNFRSSTGYGKEFLQAGNKQWGLKIQDDITDGVQWAIDQGIADPERIGIYGASFGGYATLAGITYTPDLYAAAVDYVGVSNIFTLLNTIPPYWETMRNLFYERVGHPEKDKDLLTAVSPIFHADKIKTPLFVAQGANDPRVNKAESDQIVEALRARGVDVEYMLKDNEGHGFANEENRIEFYNAMVKFFDSHLK